MTEELHKFNITCPNSIDSILRQPFECNPVYRDFYHYTGRAKLWQEQNWTRLRSLHEISSTSKRDELWAGVLRKTWKKYNLGPVRDLFPEPSRELIGGWR